MTAKTSECLEVTQSVTHKRLREKSSKGVENKHMAREGLDNAYVGDEGIRKKQIFQGMVKASAIHKLNILIIAEYWPSVTVGLDLDCSCKLWIYTGGCGKIDSEAT